MLALVLVKHIHTVALYDGFYAVCSCCLLILLVRAANPLLYLLFGLKIIIVVCILLLLLFISKVLVELATALDKTAPQTFSFCLGCLLLCVCLSSSSLADVESLLRHHCEALSAPIVKGYRFYHSMILHHPLFFTHSICIRISSFNKVSAGWCQTIVFLVVKLWVSSLCILCICIYSCIE